MNPPLNPLPYVRLARILVALGLIALGLAGAAPGPAVARVGAQRILASELEPSARAEEMARQRDPRFDREVWLREQRRQALEGKVWTLLSEAFLKEVGMQPTAAEVESLARYLGAVSDKQSKMMAEHRVKLEAEMRAPGTSADRRRELSERIQQIGKTQGTLEQHARQGAADPAVAKMMQESRRQVAEHSVRQWKLNKALYERYGGRVIFQQAGLEPLDAMQAFLDESRKQKRYEILDPAYADIFAELRRYAAQKHTEMPRSEADFYFAQPWWERSPEEMAARESSGR